MAKIQAEAVPEALQKHWALHNVQMIDKENYKGQTIFYGEGGPHHDAKESENLEEGDEWMRDGYYVSAWGLQRGSAIIGFPLYFKLQHDPDIPSSKKRGARVGSAKYAAHSAVDAMINVGLLENFQGSILIPN